MEVNRTSGYVLYWTIGRILQYLISDNRKNSATIVYCKRLFQVLCQLILTTMAIIIPTFYVEKLKLEKLNSDLLLKKLAKMCINCHTNSGLLSVNHALYSILQLSLNLRSIVSNLG